MSRRQRGSRRAAYRATGSQAPDARSAAYATEDEQGPSLREQLEQATVPALALLPIRFFFGITFVYAGVAKLLDPTFFDASNPASIYGQLQAFTHVSPLAPLVQIVEPFAFVIGLLIALAEIAVGLGALTGLAFRLAAAGGAALSILFWLTASWSTQPYFYGPDLPYAFGWITLALAGDGGLLVHRSVRELGAYVTDDWPGSLRSGSGYRVRGQRGVVVEASPARRQMLQAGALGAFALAIGSLSLPLRFLQPESSEASTLGAGTGTGAPPAGSGIATGGDAGTGAGAGSGTTGSGTTGTSAGSSAAARPVRRQRPQPRPPRTRR